MVTTWTLTRVGDLAILLKPESWVPETGILVARSMERLPNVLAAVAGYDSIYLITDGAVSDEAIGEALDPPEARQPASRHVIRVAVDRSTGADLADFLAAKSMTLAQFHRQLRSVSLRVRHLGFRPGFAYLDGAPDLFDIPRLESPRRRVPAGSFAVAAGMAGFYPDESPGGWWLLGRSDQRFWRQGANPPNLLSPGDHVQFELCSPSELQFETEEQETPLGEPFATLTRASGEVVQIEGPGDWTRIAAGRSVGGTLDPEMTVAANAAVGNPPSATVLEVFGHEVEIVFQDDALLSWYGASADVLIDGRHAPSPHQFGVRAGESLTIRPARSGRGWIAVRGGFSNSPAGRVGSGSPLYRHSDSKLESPRIRAIEREASSQIDVAEGPHLFDPALLSELLGSDWRLSPQSSRIGSRFTTNTAIEKPPIEQRSIGTQPGSVQWTPAGELIALGAEHPVTGGYPQPFTILRSELWKIASLVPGDLVHFRLVRQVNCSEITV